MTEVTAHTRAKYNVQIPVDYLYFELFIYCLQFIRELNLNFITTTNSLSIDLPVDIQYNGVKYHFMADIYLKKLGKLEPVQMG